MSLNATSIGRKMTMPIRLNQSCTVAAANARLNSSARPMWPRLTRVLVTVVPMLAPITIGIATPTGRPPATRPTMIDVTVLDDCTRAVVRVPRSTPTKGFVAKAKSRSAPACPPTARRKPSPTTPTATRSR